MALLVVLAAGAAVAAPAPLPGPNADLKKMQGVWALVSSTDGWMDRAARRNITVVVTGSCMAYTENGEVLSEWLLRLDATKSPKACDRRPARGEAAASRGIYKLEGDTLTFHYSLSDSVRPVDFDLARGGYLEVWRRVKPGPRPAR